MVRAEESKLTVDRSLPPDECFGCFVIGTGTMGLLAVYWNHLRMCAPKTAKVNRLFLGTMSVGFAGVAVYQLVGRYNYTQRVAAAKAKQ